VVGGASDASDLQRLLDVPLLEWPPRPRRRADDVAEQRSAPLGGLELASTGSDVA
jgi:hypothetical protein